MRIISPIFAKSCVPFHSKSLPGIDQAARPILIILVSLFLRFGSVLRAKEKPEKFSTLEPVREDIIL